MGLAHNPKIVTDGLVLCLDAANPKSYPGSGTTWTDLSKNGNDGTLVNGVGYSGDNKGSMTFDGVDDYITVGSISETITDNVTVVCFVKRGADGFNGSLFGFGTAASSTQDIYFWGGDGSRQFGFNTWNGDSWGIANSTNSGKAMDGNWHHIVAIFDRSNIFNSSIYVDKILQSLTQVRGTTLNRSVSSNFGIGVNGWNTGNQLFRGNISNVQIYNRALTETEVQQNFAATRGRYGI